MFSAVLFYFHFSVLLAFVTPFAPVPIISSLLLIYWRQQEVLLLWASIAGAAGGHVLNINTKVRDHVGLIVQFIMAYILFDGRYLLFEIDPLFVIPILATIDYFTLTKTQFTLKATLTLPLTLLCMIITDFSIQLLLLPIYVLLVSWFYLMKK